MTGPLGNSEFCSLESQCFINLIKILGKQNSLFPSGPVIKCLMFPCNMANPLQVP